MKIGVKFCGNCNPEIDVSCLYNLLLEEGHKSGNIYFEKINVLNFNGKYDVTLFINGCKKGCLNSSGKGDEIIINGFMFEGESFYNEHSLAIKVIKELKNMKL